MLLVLDAIDRSGETRRFATNLSTLEAGFDFLSSLVGKGSILLKAYIKDGQQRYDLPVDAFDGNPLAVDITTLQDEWQVILSKDACKYLLHEDRVWLANQGVEQCTFRIRHHKRMLDWASSTGHQPSFKTKDDLAQHDERLTYHQNQLVQAECRLSVMENWLGQLRTIC